MAAMPTARLDPASRRAALERLAREQLDVLVVGGGVTGAGVALDAATRGLSVGLVEQRDFAAGTSSRSSKLIHGGLRYLEQGNLTLVREALRERSLLLNRLAPHLVRPVPFLYPLTARLVERAYVGAGVALYDLLAGLSRQDTGLPRHRHLSRDRTLRDAPALRGDVVVGAIRFWDAQVDDARHTVTLARTAAAYGAALASSVRLVALEREAGRVVGAHLHDLEGGRRVTARARTVVNATGVWTDEVQAMAGAAPQHRGARVRASKGVHLVVPHERIPGSSGILLRTSTSVLFVIPWSGRNGHWIIGTTDTAWDLGKAHPAASARDIDYLLAQVNSVLRTPLRRGDVQGVYAGLRPLLAGQSEATSELSREHAVFEAVPGLVTVAGGKYTTYRVMAADAVDAVGASLGRSLPPSVTARIPLLGAVGAEAVANARTRLASASRLPEARVDHLLRRYGALVPEVLALLEDHPELSRPIPGAEAYLLVEACYAASHEGALHLDDVLTRRLRISIETADRGRAAARAVAAVVAPVLGWDAAAVARELAHYDARVAAERESQSRPDDRTADAARMGAPDVRTGAG